VSLKLIFSCTEGQLQSISKRQEEDRSCVSRPFPKFIEPVEEEGQETLVSLVKTREYSKSVTLESFAQDNA